MFATIVGGALALVFIGLPLAIIGLFIQSLLERRNKEACRGRCGIQAHRLRTLAGARRDYVGSTTFASAEHVGDGSPPRTGHPDCAPITYTTPHSARDHSRAERRGPNSDRHSMAVRQRLRPIPTRKRARSPRVTAPQWRVRYSCPALAASRSRSDAPPGRGSKAARLAIGMFPASNDGRRGKTSAAAGAFKFDHNRPRPPTLGCGFQQTPGGI